MIKVIQGLRVHAEAIIPKEVHTLNPDWRNDLISAVEAWESRTFVQDGEVLAIVGFTPLYSKTGEFWAVVSKDIIRHRTGFSRAAKRTLGKWILDKELYRVQMVVHADYRDTFDFAVFLGFKPEGLMRKYGPEGGDYYMMGRV